MLGNHLEKGIEVTVEKKYLMHLPTAEAHREWHPTGREVHWLSEFFPQSLKKHMKLL